MQIHIPPSIHTSIHPIIPLIHLSLPPCVSIDQVVTARVDVKGNLYVEDWDVLEAESGSMIEALRKCQTNDTEA